MTGPPTNTDALIFDLDGTLWDSTETVAQAWTLALQRCGESPRTVTPDEIAWVMGKTHREIYRAMFPGLAEPEQERLILACYVEEERQLHRQGGRLYPGIAGGLEQLAGCYPLFIVSNCQQGYIESFLAWSGLASLFRDFECHGNTGLGKGENLTLIRGRNGLSEPLYIGDTQGDQDAAAAAGMPFIHAAYGFGQVRRPCPRLEHFNELVARFAPSSGRLTG